MKAVETGLVRYDAMCSAIAECHKVDEVKELRDKARALEVYAKQALNYEAERQAAQIRMRAEHRAGELLKQMKERGERHPRGGDQKSNSRDTSLKLADFGISYDQAAKWQQLADIPKAEFEEELAKPGIPSTEGILHSRSKNGQQDPTIKVGNDALWFWGRLREFETEMFHLNPNDLFKEMLETMQSDTRRIAPKLISWLGRLRT